MASTGPRPDHPVAELLLRRRAAGSLPGTRDDGCTVGLAVEGGGMRGVVSAGMLVALEDLGFHTTVDAIYGCSSGALNGAYFLMGEGWRSLSIYYDDLTSRSFVDVRRAVRRQPVLALDYFFDEIMERRKPLDYDAILGSPIPLHVAVTSVDRVELVDATGFESREDLKAALRAGAWLPLVAGPPTTFRGERAMDGGMLLGHPFRLALEDGCTHVLSLSTKPRGDPRWLASQSQKLLARHMERLRKGLGAGYLRAVRDYAEARRLLERARLDAGAPPYVLDVAPPAGTREVGRFEQDRAVLLDGARGGYEALVEALEGRTVRVIPRLTVPREWDAPAGGDAWAGDAGT